VWTGFIWLRLVAVVCACEQTIRTFSSRKGGEFLDLLSNYQLLKEALICCLFSNSYFQHFESSDSFFPQFKAKFDADRLFFQVCQFLAIPKSHTEQQALLHYTTQQSHMLQPYSKQEMSQQNIFYLQSAAEVHTSSSNAISPSVQKLLDFTKYVKSGCSKDQNSYVGGLTPHKQVLKGNGT
jgi:hypothetical protein